MPPHPPQLGKWAADRVAELDGQRLRYRYRPGDGSTPLVLVNGIGAAMEMWTHFVAQLDDRPLIAFDLPGSGESEAPRYPVGMGWFAGRLDALLTHLGLTEPVDVLGFSFGGTVAQQFVHDFPHRVRRLVLASTTPGFPAMPGSPLALLIASTPMRYLDPALGELLVPQMVGGRTLRDRKVLLEEMPLRQEVPPTWWGYLTQLGAIATWSSSWWIGRVQAPTLVLHGTDDRLCPTVNARWLAKAMPDARYVEVAGAGHLLLIDEAPRAVRIIREFLLSPEPPGGRDQSDRRRSASSAAT